MAQDHCPRCDNLIERDIGRCPFCDLHLHYEDDPPEDSSGEKGKSFFGLPRFLKKEDPDWTAPEVPLHRPLWPAWLSFLTAGLLIAAYRAPLLHLWNRIIGKTDEEISIQILPVQSRGSGSSTPTSGPIGTSPVDRTASIRAKWVFSGEVYDLITMKPVPRTTLVFEDVGLNRRFKTSCKKDGHFRIKLPEASTDGYNLEVRSRRYATRALVEDSTGAADHLRSLSVSQRKKLGRDFTRTIRRSQPISPADNAESLELFLVPISPS